MVEIVGMEVNAPAVDETMIIAVAMIDLEADDAKEVATTTEIGTIHSEEMAQALTTTMTVRSAMDVETKYTKIEIAPLRISMIEII